MGYETKVYFVKPSTLDHNFVKIEGEWFLTYLEGNEEVYYKEEEDSTIPFDKGFYLERGRYLTLSYARPIASFDLNKVGSISADTTKLFTYESGGDTPMIEDMYGDRLKQLSLHDFVKWIDNRLETRNYRALKACKALAESLIEEYNDVQVLIYGH